MTCYIEKYKGGRNWAVMLKTEEQEDEIIAVVLYKRGAESVKAVTDALIRTKTS